MFSTLKNHCIGDKKGNVFGGKQDHVALLLLGGKGSGRGGLDRSRKHIMLTETFSCIVRVIFIAYPPRTIGEAPRCWC